MIKLAFLTLKTYDLGKALIILIHVTKAYRRSTELLIINLGSG
jgi:hypothetical protein